MADEIDDFIGGLIPLVRALRGALYTSTRLRDNPNVCYAACEWVLHQSRNGTAAHQIITQMAVIDKNTLKPTHEYINKGPSMPKTILKSVKDTIKRTGEDVSDPELNALRYMMDQHRQPDNYTNNQNQAATNIVQALRRNADRVMVYMSPASGKTGHVICIFRHVAGLVIYDPNIGFISLPLADPNGCAGVISNILRWYRENMALSNFGFKIKT
jgi:hypothetical protein